VSEQRLGVIVLAAGRGTRMKSELPKVLHPVCGKPMAGHVVDAAKALLPARLAVVAGYGRALVEAAIGGEGVRFVEQTELLGTADAVKRCRAAMDGCDEVMVLYGDAPLMTTDMLETLRAARGAAPLVFSTMFMDDPARFGRVQRDEDGRVAGIVEAADYTGPAGPAEVNTGRYVFDARWLWAHVVRVPVSAKGEYYLTDLTMIAAAEGTPAVTALCGDDPIVGVDDRVALARAEAILRNRLLERHMLNGVTIVDPATTYVHAGVEIAADVTILPNCYLYGSTRVAARALIGPGTTLSNAIVGEDSVVRSSVIEDSAIGARVSCGPFAHLRENARVGNDCELGNYAEVKNSVVGDGVKMHHFSFLGDADVGERTNVAAGTITCNFDGVKKHRTTVGKDVFLGCDTMLIAPVTIGDGAFTATGSVVTKDVPAGGRVAGVPARPFPPSGTGS
jgi:bifunctional UDP-N-acetylglucosamine pyrophosphorylase/glucosamine-1-phosphate N-acetyltransferase